MGQPEYCEIGRAKQHTGYISRHNLRMPALTKLANPYAPDQRGLPKPTQNTQRDLVGDQASLSAAWSAVADWFGGQVPPATLLGVAGLGYVGQLVEIDTTIVKA